MSQCAAKGNKRTACQCNAERQAVEFEYQSVLAVTSTQPEADGVASTQTSLRIMQMDCPVEENLIRKKLGGMSNVRHLQFDLMRRVLVVTHTPDSLDSILAAIRTLGFEPDINLKEAATSDSSSKKAAWPLLIAAGAAIAAEIATWTGWPVWLEACLALLAVFSCGLTTYKKGWIAIRNADLNINASMSVAVTGALALGQWPEAATVMVLFTLAERVEASSLDRARNAIKSLMQLAPETAMVRQADGSWLEMSASNVLTDAVVRVKPGERIGLDGDIIDGRTAINQAPVTGESMPVDKKPGDKVFAGTINGAGTFKYRVTATASHTTLARIIHAVEQAQGTKAPVQRFIDRFSRIYTPSVFMLALVVAVLPPLLNVSGWQEGIYKGLVILVIACPCALVISTPVTIVSGLTAAARRGILIKGGIYLELGRKMTWLALDKTGTVTQGKPVLTDQEYYGDMSKEEVSSLAGSLAMYSDHPVSRALADATQHTLRQDIESFSALLGQGIMGEIKGKNYWLGNLRLADESKLVTPPILARVGKLEAEGKTVILLHDGEQILALYAVADTVRETSREAILQLHQLGVETAMLSGDNAQTARAIATQVGITDVRGNQLPDDKHRAVETYRQRGITGMVGDGINDAPALASADIGFAMGAIGTDTAIETADVALMDDDLRKISLFIRLSRRTHRILMQNITLTLGIKAIFLALTLAGMGTLWMAVFADVGASLLVVANGLRLLKAFHA